jgi:hypothetical protein
MDRNGGRVCSRLPAAGGLALASRRIDELERGDATRFGEFELHPLFSAR